MTKHRTPKINRLLEIIALLNRHPEGLSAQWIAEKCKTTRRTIFRDLKTLSNDLNIELAVKSGRWKILPGSKLPPIRFTYDEATILLMAIRIYPSFINTYDPHVDSIFTKLSSILPEFSSRQLNHVVKWMKIRKFDTNYADILLQLSRAWNECRRIKIQYFSILSNKNIESVIDIYLIQPVDRIQGIWVIGNDPENNRIEMFDLHHISKVEILENRYTIPFSFNPVQYLFPMWDYDKFDKIQTIRLKFHPKLYPLLHKTIWHHTQKITVQPDNSIIATFNVSPNMLFKSFIFSFGYMVEVLEPVKLRNEIAKIAQHIVDVYRHET
jgi:predicted DNA-binding transcriptional regulator YafY